ncbi:hypothetical protein [Streptococcus gordonii]|uniref:hypothetical protein n=1 Tax=Streptococcus gordonii TaxID=1302 RepID=UPI0023AF11C0|nr:hypothetical protein [Streptococcus gordonii]MDE8687917.1 hypothetical protein [Streptococcus gordonii]
MYLITFVDKLTPVLVVVIPSYFSYKSNKSSKETDKRIEALSEDFGELKGIICPIVALLLDPNLIIRYKTTI